jgi:hypothetical protein
VDAVRCRIDFTRPSLPAFLKEVHVRGLSVGEAAVDLSFYRHDEDVGVHVTRQDGRVQIAVLK